MHGEPCPPSLRAAAATRIGAIAFICHIGPAPDAHRHFQSVVIDGVLVPAPHRGGAAVDPDIALDPLAIATAQAKARRRLPARFVRRALLEPDDARAMAHRARHGGFAVEVSVTDHASPPEPMWSALSRVGGCPLDGWCSGSTTVL